MTCMCVFKNVPKMYWSKLKSAKNEPAGVEPMGDFVLFKQLRVSSFKNWPEKLRIHRTDTDDFMDFCMMSVENSFLFEDITTCEHVEKSFISNNFSHYGNQSEVNSYQNFDGSSFLHSSWKGLGVMNVKENTIYFMPYSLDMSKEIEDEDLFYDFLNHEDSNVSIEDMCDIDGSAFDEYVPENIIEQVIEYNYA